MIKITIEIEEPVGGALVFKYKPERINETESETLVAKMVGSSIGMIANLITSAASSTESVRGDGGEDLFNSLVAKTVAERTKKS